MSYAENTSVSVERSRAEMERTLVRYGADSFTYGWDGPKAAVAFRADGRYVRFLMSMPEMEEFGSTPTGQARSRASMEKAWEQAQRQRWRALSLVIKAKLEAVESGITTFDEEFLAHVLLPDGTTVGDFMVGQVDLAYEGGKMPSLLPMAQRQLTRGK